MALRQLLFTGVILATAASAGPQACGQASGQAAPSTGLPAVGSRQRPVARTNPALEFFGRPRSLSYTRQSRPRPMPQGQQLPTGAATKPFSGVQQTSAISPYLALDNLETSTSMPNYFLFVRPQLEMQAQQRAQQQQNWRTQQHARAAGGGSGNPPGDAPVTGHGAQFMNSGGYYPSLR